MATSSENFMKRIDKELARSAITLKADAANGHPHFVNLNPSENHTEFDELDPIDIITTTLLNHCEADFERLLDQKNIVTLHWSIKESSVVHYINRIGDKINAGCLWEPKKVALKKATRPHPDFEIQYLIQENNSWTLNDGFEGEGKTKELEFSPKELAIRFATLLLQRQIWRGQVNNFVRNVTWNWIGDQPEPRARRGQENKNYAPEHSPSPPKEGMMIDRPRAKRAGILFRSNVVEGRGRKPRTPKQLKFPDIFKVGKKPSEKTADKTDVKNAWESSPAPPLKNFKLEIIEPIAEPDSSGEEKGPPVYEEMRSSSGRSVEGRKNKRSSSPSTPTCKEQKKRRPSSPPTPAMVERAAMEAQAAMKAQAALKAQAAVEAQAALKAQAAVEAQAAMEAQATIEKQAVMEAQIALEAQAAMEERAAIKARQAAYLGTVMGP